MTDFDAAKPGLVTGEGCEAPRGIIWPIGAEAISRKEALELFKYPSEPVTDFERLRALVTSARDAGV